MSEPWWNRVYLGSCERMDAIPGASVHCIVTSPPSHLGEAFNIELDGA